MDYFEYSIPNWDKHNDRPDRKNYTWFKFDNSYFRDKKVFKLDNLSKLLFVYLLCERSKTDKSEVFLIVDVVCADLREKKQNILKAYDTLKSSDVITTSLCRHNDVMMSSPDKIRGDKIREEYIDQKLESLYFSLYPRKIGKTKGISKLLSSMKSDEDLALLEKSIKNYAEHVAGKSPEYIKHFSTFASEWRDWVDAKKELSSEESKRSGEEEARIKREQEYQRMLREAGL